MFQHVFPQQQEAQVSPKMSKRKHRKGPAARDVMTYTRVGRSKLNHLARSFTPQDFEGEALIDEFDSSVVQFIDGQAIDELESLEARFVCRKDKRRYSRSLPFCESPRNGFADSIKRFQRCHGQVPLDTDVTLSPIDREEEELIEAAEELERLALQEANQLSDHELFVYAAWCVIAAHEHDMRNVKSKVTSLPRNDEAKSRQRRPDVASYAAI